VAPNESASPTDLVAVKKAPASLASDDPAWREADATTIKTTVVVGSEATGPNDVAVQALRFDCDSHLVRAAEKALEVFAGDWKGPLKAQ